jgi:hypothetical protein
MTVTLVGELSIGESIPGAAAVGVAGVAGINAALPDIQARLDALLGFSPTPIDFAAQLTLLNETMVSVNLAIAGGIVPPSIAAQIAEVSAQIAALLAAVVSINAQLGIILDFQALLTNPGVFAYAFAGQVEDLGDELDAELAAGLPGGGGPTESVDALVLITNVGATWTAMSQIFQVTP